MNLLGRFVTANLKGTNEPRQGWVVEIDPLIIRGQSGSIYKCDGEPVVVENPPVGGKLTMNYIDPSILPPSVPDKHPILLRCYNLIQAIESCGVSEQSTRVLILTGELTAEIEKMLDLIYELHNIVGIAHDAVHECLADNGFKLEAK